MSTAQRRAEQRERLVTCAEHLIATRGLGALRARDLATAMGCAVGALYNLVADLDELVLLVAIRTKNDLSRSFDAAAAKAGESETRDDLFVEWAWAYFRFARDNRTRWRALFEFRLPPGVALPLWFEREQEDLFLRLENRLSPLMPGLDPVQRKIKARVLFSAVHGIVSLALEEKLASMPVEAIEGELDAFVRAYLRGLRSPSTPAESDRPHA